MKILVTGAAGFIGSQLAYRLWKNGDEHTTQTVYISRLEAHILEVEGVEDVSNTKINKAPSNLILESNQIPILGGVVIK